MLIIALILMIFGKKITLRDRILISYTINNESLQGLIKLTKKILKYTLIFELIGALFISIDLIPAYGVGKGIFKSLFQSISIFCGAGIDIFSNETSFIILATNKIMNITCIVLATISSLGFLVWDDIGKCFEEGVRKKFRLRRIIRNFSLHTKLVLISQIVLVIIGVFIFMIFEYENINTIGEFDLQDKLLISVTHSVASRSSGFATLDLSNVKDITKIMLSILMFIGGAPGSVAGGIKTTTLIVIILGVITNIRGKKNMNILKRTISNGTFVKAVSVVTIAIFVLSVSNIILVCNSDIYILDLFFDSVSAFATVGLTSGALVKMNIFCKSIIMLLMYIGRVGTTTMALTFVMKKPKENDLVVYAKEDIIVG